MTGAGSDLAVVPDLGASGRRVIGGNAFDLDRATVVMAIVNRTPDSFFDAGRTFGFRAAVDRCRQALDEGAEWLDIGGVPFSPLAGRVSAAEETARVVPLVEAVREFSAAVVSVDTTRSAVAAAALAAGASAVNDTSGLSDPEMAGVVASHRAAVVITHSLAAPGRVLDRPTYADVCGEVLAFLRQRIARATGAGVPPEQIIVDPGHDLNKNTLHSLELTRGLAAFSRLGHPLLVSVSNKDFIGETIGAPKDARGPATAAVLAFCVRQGARVVRVHDVAAAVGAVRMTEALLGLRSPLGSRHNVEPTGP
ncbi:MAG: dihydropteroate synthase [Kineosporiaceae bacterium]